MFPVVEGVEGAVVLFTPLPNGKSAGGLLLKEGHPVVEFCLMNFLFSVHENLLMSIRTKCTNRTNRTKRFEVIVS